MEVAMRGTLSMKEVVENVTGKLAVENAKLKADNASLRKAIEDAPHDILCASRGKDPLYPKIPVPCNCWKAAALKEGK